MDDQRNQIRDLSARAGLLRGRNVGGSSTSRSVIDEISKDGPVEIFHTDASSGDIVLESVQDVSPILKANQEEFKSGDGYTPSRDLKKVASIPLIEVHKLLQQGIDIYNADDWSKIAAKLDDPDWLKFRTSPGKISKKPNREYFRASTRS